MRAIESGRKKRIIKGYKEIQASCGGVGRSGGELKEYAEAVGVAQKTILKWIRNENKK
jgi:hypothetical protein